MADNFFFLIHLLFCTGAILNYGLSGRRGNVFVFLLTLGEGKMVPRLKLNIVIQSSFGLFLMVKLMKHVIMEMYSMVI